MISDQRRAVAQAGIDYLDTGVVDLDANIGGFLQLANLEYLYQWDEAANAINKITAGHRNLSKVATGLLTARGDSRPLYDPNATEQVDVQSFSPGLASSLIVPVLPYEYSFDLKVGEGGPISLIDGDTHAEERRAIVNDTSSALEHAALEGLTNADAISTIKSLQLANERSIPIIKIDPYTSSSTIYALLSLGTSDEGSIAPSLVVAGQSGFPRTAPILMTGWASDTFGSRPAADSATPSLVR